MPARRFKYDGRHKVVRCPAGKCLERSSRPDANSWIYRARASDCRQCPLRERCVAPSASARVIRIADGQESLLRARRGRPRWDESMREAYVRHRWRSEGVHGEAKTCHGLRRAVRRGLDNMAIQSSLTAAVLNLKRLAASLSLFWRYMLRVAGGLGRSMHVQARTSRNAVHFCCAAA